MKKKAAAAAKKSAPKKKAPAAKKPVAKASSVKAAAKPEAPRPAGPAVETTRRVATYTPSPVEGIGWAPFRYPPQ
ncbi:MAG TPA: hypothetical protein VMS64_03060 [Candidatus Methylomirabilis sp.]|nr:hypothetical protein [Candidatus Methylomirabilis sp.]